MKDVNSSPISGLLRINRLTTPLLKPNMCHPLNLVFFFPAIPDTSEQVDYPDDFEEIEDKDDDEGDCVHADAAQQPHDEALVEEFQLCDAGGLTITLKVLKEKG